jgi:hypothetical protein
MALAKVLLKIRDRGGIERSLRANPAQIAFERHRGSWNIVLKARQMGITSWVAGRFFLKTITASGVLSVQVAHTRKAAEGIFRMVQRFWECLPPDLRCGALRRSVANVGAMRFPELDSEFRVLSAADRNAGRGLTMQNLHCSEVSRWPGNAAETMAGLRAALAPGGELVMESTPNGAYGCFHEEWTKAIDPGAMEEDNARSVVIRHFFPWFVEPVNRAAPAKELTAEEAELIRIHGLTLEQIGFRRGLEESYRDLRSQEYAEDPETCFRATGDCCFDVAAIEARLKSVPVPTSRRKEGALQVWLPPQRERRYIVGVDSAGGSSEGDFAAAQVIEEETGLQCAELRQRLRPAELAKAAAELAKEYFGALVAVERNNHGAAVIAYLETQEHYANVYANGPVPGWNTSAASKPVMVALMGSLLSEFPGMFFSRRLLGECRTFVASTGGATGAASGAHDDCFMAMAVAQSVRRELLQRRR